MTKKKTEQVKSIKVTAAHIRAALIEFYPHPDYGIVFEVARGTGYAAHRHVDAVAMHTWPSRGLNLSAIEIKVDRGDWRRELKDPAKAEQIAAFCDEFVIAAPRDVVPVAELPQAWGLLEYDPTTKKLTRRVTPTKTKAQPVTREFLAAIMRAAGRPMDPRSVDHLVDKRKAELDARFADDVEQAVSRRNTNNSRAAQHWNELVEAVCPDTNDVDGPRKFWRADAPQFVQVFKALHESGVMERWRGLRSLAETLRGMSKGLDEALARHKVPVDPK